MADFNAYPALDVRVPQMQPGVDIGSVFEQANKIQAGRNENSLFPLKQQEEQNKLSLFPLQREASQTENAMNKLILDQAKQAQQYNNVNRQLKGIAEQFDSDPRAAEQAWDQLMSSFPEGKQWIGKISSKSINTALKTYGQQELTATNRVRAAATVAQQDNSFAGAGAGSGLAQSQMSQIGNMNPQQTQQTVAKYNEALDEVSRLENSKDPEKEWNQQLQSNPHFSQVVGGAKYSPDRLTALRNEINSRLQAMSGFGVNATSGLQNPQEPLKFQQSGDSIFSEDPYNRAHPLKEVGRGASKPNWQLDTYTEKDGETYPVYHDTTSGKQKIGDFPAVGGKYNTKGGAEKALPEQIADWVDRIHKGAAKIGDVPKELKTPVNSGLDALEKVDRSIPGTTGKPEIDAAADGYTSAPLDRAGSWSQAAIDSAAADYAATNRYPAGLGIGTAGPTGLTKIAIANRAAEMFPGGIPTEKRAQVQALTAAMRQQVQTAATTERAVQNFDNTFQHLTTAFKDKVNDYTTPLANMIANPAKYQLDPGTLGAFRAGLQEVSNEYNFVNGRGGQITDQVRKQSGDILPGNLNMKDLQKIHDELSAQGKIIVKGGYNEANKVSNQFASVRSGAALGGGSDAALPSGLSEDDITHTMQLRNMTRAQVIERFKSKK